MPETPQNPESRRAASSIELHAITDAMEKLVEHLDTSLPEERVKALLETARREERRSRRRLFVSLGGIALIATLVSSFGLAQSRSNGDQLDEIKVVSSFVQNCLQHAEKLTPQERIEQCGGSDQDAERLVQALVRFNICTLLILPENRTEANLTACATKVFGG